MSAYGGWVIGVLRLAHPDGQVFDFDAGTLCLELACTGGEGFRARFEVLHTPADFVAWAALSRLDLLGRGVRPEQVGTHPADLTALKRLREAIWTVGVAAAGRAGTSEPAAPGGGTGTGTSEPTGPARRTGTAGVTDVGWLVGLERELAVLNELAAGPGVVPRLDPASGTTVWRQPVQAGQLVTEIARDAVRTFGSPAVDRVRMCAGHRCSLIYLDTSRPGQRRWCSMQRCGNRNKVADHRRRQQGVAGSP